MKTRTPIYNLAMTVIALHLAALPSNAQDDCDQCNAVLRLSMDTYYRYDATQYRDDVEVWFQQNAQSYVDSEESENGDLSIGPISLSLQSESERETFKALAQEYLATRSVTLNMLNRVLVHGLPGHIRSEQIDAWKRCMEACSSNRPMRWTVEGSASELGSEFFIIVEAVGAAPQASGITVSKIGPLEILNESELATKEVSSRPITIEVRRIGSDESYLRIRFDQHYDDLFVQIPPLVSVDWTHSFGALEEINYRNNSQIEAVTDGIVVAYVGHGDTSNLIGQVKSRGRDYVTVAGGSSSSISPYYSIIFPVPRGSHWRIAHALTPGGNWQWDNVTVYWLPIQPSPILRPR